jgi:signal peptidase II
VRGLQERRTVVTPLTAPHRLLGRRLLIPVVAAAVIVADQMTKTWALHQIPPSPGRHVVGPVWLNLTFNRGAAFGLGHGVTPVVEAVVVVLVAWLVFFGRRASRAASLPVAIGLGLLIGGAAGNLIDRLFRHNRGAVIDFIDAVRVGSHDWWPVFNVADASIVVGVVIIVLAYSVGAGRRRAAPGG